MKSESKSEMDDELRPEYDLKKMLEGGVRGKYAERCQTNTNVVLLEPDVAEAFPSAEVVNEALRLVMQLAELQKRVKRSNTKTGRTPS